MVALVQGVLIRYINPKLGPARSVYTGMFLYVIGLIIFGFASSGWIMYIALIPYCLGGISGPSLQGIMSSQVAASEQGELQGALASLVSLTSIVGPPLMTNTFSYFTSSTAFVYFPGAVFLLGAALGLISLAFCVKALRNYKEPAPITSSQTIESSSG